MEAVLAFISSPGAEIKLGLITLRWYGILISFSVLIGLIISSRLAKYRNISNGAVADLMPILILSSVIGARFYYVLFEPKRLDRKERFIFDDAAYIRLKRAKLPDSLMAQLLKLHGRSFKPEELKIVMGRLINADENATYLGIIKSQTRENRRSDAVNLAAVHYNLGIVHQLLRELEVASYHFAQANAHQPKDKYAQKWADTQIMMGVYNPVDSLTGLTITKAGTSQAPEQSMVRNKVEPAINMEGLDLIPTETEMPELKPVELPPLTNELQPQDVGSAQGTSP